MNYQLIVFDVDGTLTTTRSGATFRQSAYDWQWLPRRVEKCHELIADGVRLALASNQAGVAFPWSKFTEAEIRAENEQELPRRSCSCGLSRSLCHLQLHQSISHRKS